MTKLSNSVEYLNQCLPKAHAEFLLMNGFACASSKNQLDFVHHHTRLVIQQDQVDLFIYHPEDPGQENEKWVFEQSHTGIVHLDIHHWIMLLISMKVITLGGFLKNSRLRDHQFYTEAQFIIKSLLTTQIV